MSTVPFVSSARTACLVAALAVPAAACIHPIHRTAREECAENGLVLGATSSASVGGAVGASTGFLAGSSMQCMPAQTALERCQAEVLADVGRRKEDYGILGKNVLTGVGYAAFVVPGLVFYGAFSMHRGRVVDSIRRSEREGMARCQAQFGTAAAIRAVTAPARPPAT